MLLVKADGSKWRLMKDGTEKPYRWYHDVARRVRERWHNRHWIRRQKEFERTGTRYYGDGGTIHNSIKLNVEMSRGRVCSVWFRCQALPFDVTVVDDDRAADMHRMYVANTCELHGVEVRDVPKEGD